MFLKSVATMVVFKGLGGLTRVSSPLVLIWLMGASDLGELVVSVAVATLVFGIVNLGLPQTAVHFVASGRMSSAKVLRLALMIGAGIAVTGSSIAGLLVLFGHVEWTLVVSIGLLPALLVFHRVSAAVLLGAEKVAAAGRVSVAGEVTPAAFAIVVAATNASWSIVFLAWTLGVALAAALAVAQAWRVKLPGRDESFRVTARYSGSIHLSSLSTLASYRIDVVLLASLAGAAEAGRYAVIVAVAEGLWLFSMAVSDIISVKTARSPGETIQLVETLSRLLLASNVALTGIAWLGIWLLGDRFGLEKDMFTVVLVLFGVATLSASRVLATYMAASGRPERNVAGSVGALAINVAANVILIPRLGIAGAALATSISYTVTLLVRTNNHAALTGSSRRFIIPRAADAQVVLERVGALR